MKYVNDFRDKSLAVALAREIAAEVRPDREYRLMEFCGGHTHAIFRYGVTDLLPPQVRMIHGPGCPSACCRWAASTWRSGWPRRRA
jgi:hydrogenase expression/formation protein HypD